MSKCEHCPLRTEDRSCLGQRNTAICAHTDRATDQYRPSLVAKVVNFTPPTPESKRLAVVESITLVARMKACPEWISATDCGCGTNRCRLGRGRGGKVTHQDCFACLRSTGVDGAVKHVDDVRRDEGRVDVVG